MLGATGEEDEAQIPPDIPNYKMEPAETHPKQTSNCRSLHLSARGLSPSQVQPLDGPEAPTRVSI